MSVASHPYYPLALELPGYKDLVVPFERILTIFFSACGVVLLLAWKLTGSESLCNTLAGHGPCAMQQA